MRMPLTSLCPKSSCQYFNGRKALRLFFFRILYSFSSYTALIYQFTVNAKETYGSERLLYTTTFSGIQFMHGH